MMEHDILIKLLIASRCWDDAEDDPHREPKRKVPCGTLVSWIINRTASYTSQPFNLIKELLKGKGNINLSMVHVGGDWEVWLTIIPNIWLRCRLATFDAWVRSLVSSLGGWNRRETTSNFMLILMNSRLPPRRRSFKRYFNKLIAENVAFHAIYLIQEIEKMLIRLSLHPRL